MAFPTTSILDSFNRANEDPIDTGWDGTHIFVAGDSGKLALISNGLTNATGGGTDTSEAYDAATYSGNVEIYATLSTVSAVAADTWRLLILNENSSATQDGYELYIEKSAGTDIWRLRRRDNVVATVLGADMSQEISSGDSVGMSLVDGTLTAYYKASAGSWTTIGSRTDATYSGAWYFGVKSTQSVSGAWKADDFGGGQVSGGGGSPPASFPATTLLDDFTRANNASLGGNWTEGVNGKTNRAEIVSNAVAVTGVGASSICAFTGAGTPTSTWLAVQATAAAVSATVTDGCGLAVTKVSDTTKGYHAEVDISGTDVGITFWNDSTGLQMGAEQVATGFGLLAAGNSQGLVARDTGSQVNLEFWIFKSSVWTQVALLTASGGDYIAGPFYPSLRVKYSGESIDDFKAAVVTAPVGGGGPGRFMTLGVG